MPKSATLDDRERPLRTLFQNTCVFCSSVDRVTSHSCWRESTDALSNSADRARSRLLSWSTRKRSAAYWRRRSGATGAEAKVGTEQANGRSIRRHCHTLTYKVLRSTFFSRPKPASCWHLSMNSAFHPPVVQISLHFTCLDLKFNGNPICLVYYCAMHVVLARYCYRKSSVCLSVCLSVTLRYAEHIGWTSSKLITRIIGLGSSLLGATTSAV